MEPVVLGRLEWLTSLRDAVDEKQSGFRRSRCTADALADVVSFLEQARHKKEGAYLLLLDVKVGTGVPQGSVLSPLLFNLAMAHLASRLPGSLGCPVEMAIYADNGALWTRVPTKVGRRVRAALQAALNAVANHLTIVYLGLAIDETLSWRTAVGAQLDQMIRAVRGINQLLAQDRGCSHQWVLRIYRACAASRVLYALPLVTVRDAHWKTLELAHRKALRRCVGLPRDSPVASTLAETGSWPIQLLATQTARRHVERLHRAPGEDILRPRGPFMLHREAFRLLLSYFDESGLNTRP
ncbi:uncharacterized protein LOC144159228 [Haemaphysalis longicornis]